MPILPSCHHSLNNITGYIVRRTFPATGAAHVDVGTFVGAHTYVDALALARTERAEPDQYAVVDAVYFCGCRGQG